MITSETHYQGTLAAIQRFEQDLARVDEITAGLHPLARQCFASAIECQLDELRAEAAEYEARQAQDSARAGADSDAAKRP